MLALLCQALQQLLVKRLDETGVDDADTSDALAGFKGVIDGRADGEDVDPVPGAERLPAAPADVRPVSHFTLQGRFHAAARPADGAGTAQAQRFFQHALQLVRVTRHADGQVGDGAQVGQVIDALMGGSVSADETGTVNCEHDIEVLDRDVMDHLVERALQESAVDGHHRLLAPQGQTGCDRHRHVLSYTYIDVAPREAPAELDQAAAFPHRGSYHPHPLVVRHQFGDRVTERVRPLVRLGRCDRLDGVETARAVPGDRIAFRDLVAL